MPLPLAVQPSRNFNNVLEELTHLVVELGAAHEEELASKGCEDFSEA